MNEINMGSAPVAPSQVLGNCSRLSERIDYINNLLCGLEDSLMPILNTLEGSGGNARVSDAPDPPSMQSPLDREMGHLDTKLAALECRLEQLKSRITL